MYLAWKFIEKWSLERKCIILRTLCISQGGRGWQDHPTTRTPIRSPRLDRTRDPVVGKQRSYRLLKLHAAFILLMFEWNSSTVQSKKVPTNGALGFLPLLSPNKKASFSDHTSTFSWQSTSSSQKHCLYRDSANQPSSKPSLFRDGIVCNAGLPLFTWCQIQGLFHDFPGPFQANPAPSLSVKTWTLYTFLFKTNLIIRLYPKNEKQPITDHF